jgi:CheY-like chemotaxis protein
MIYPNNYILLADNNLEDLETILTSFKDLNWTSKLKTVHGTEEAIHFLQSIRDNNLPALIVFKYNRQGMSSTAAMQYLQSAHRFNNIPVVFYAAGMSSSLAYSLTAAGAHCCLQMPTGASAAQNFAKALKMIAESSPAAVADVLV